MDTNKEASEAEKIRASKAYQKAYRQAAAKKKAYRQDYMRVPQVEDLNPSRCSTLILERAMIKIRHVKIRKPIKYYKPKYVLPEWLARKKANG